MDTTFFLAIPGLFWHLDKVYQEMGILSSKVINYTERRVLGYTTV